MTDPSHLQNLPVARFHDIRRTPSRLYDLAEACILIQVSFFSTLYSFMSKAYLQPDDATRAPPHCLRNIFLSGSSASAPSFPALRSSNGRLFAPLDFCAVICTRAGGWSDIEAGGHSVPVCGFRLVGLRIRNKDSNDDE